MPSVDNTEIQHKLAAARTRLILDKPFLGALVLRLPLVAADPGWCRTAVTNARSLFYNRNYIHALDIEETQFVLAKQALHCALSHFARRQHRIKRRWELACDYAVNPLLIQDGIKAPAGTMVEDSFLGMTAEEIYPCIEEFDDDDTKTERQESTGKGNSNQDQQMQGSRKTSPDDADQVQELAQQPPELTPQEQEELSIQWQQRLAGAAQQALQAGKLGGYMGRMVDLMLQPGLPWRMLLARYMTANARNDYSYSKPSSRREGTAIFPSLRSSHIDVAIAIDTSGSISDGDMNEFLSEVDAIKGNVRARIILLPCDAALAQDAPWIFEPWEDTVLPTVLQGGGGTDFRPVFEWLSRQDHPPHLLVYFTDCEGTFPDMAPDYPVIWLVKGKKPVPWGQRVQLN